MRQAGATGGKSEFVVVTRALTHTYARNGQSRRVLAVVAVRRDRRPLVHNLRPAAPFRVSRTRASWAPGASSHEIGESQPEIDSGHPLPRPSTRTASAAPLAAGDTPRLYSSSLAGVASCFRIEMRCPSHFCRSGFMAEPLMPYRVRRAAGWMHGRDAQGCRLHAQSCSLGFHGGATHAP